MMVNEAPTDRVKGQITYQKFQRTTDSRISKSNKSKISNDNLLADLDADYKPVKILAYRNGDRFDKGTEISVTHREFKEWGVFLDSLTRKIRSLKAVRKLFTLEGQEVDDFRQLIPGLSYVAVGGDTFKLMPYGESRPLKWTPAIKGQQKRDPLSIDSNESVQILMEKMKLEYSNKQSTTSRTKFKTMTSSYDVTGAVANETMSNPELGSTVSGKNSVTLPRIYVTQTTQEGKRRKYFSTSTSRYPTIRRSNSAEKIIVADNAKSPTTATPTRHAGTQTPGAVIALEQTNGQFPQANYSPRKHQGHSGTGNIADVPANQIFADDRVDIGNGVPADAEMEFYYDNLPDNGPSDYYPTVQGRRNAKPIKHVFYG